MSISQLRQLTDYKANKPLMALFKSTTVIRKYDEVLKQNRDYRPLSVALESLEEGLVTDDIPVGDVKKKITELSLRALDKQTKSFNVVLEHTKTIAKEWLENSIKTVPNLSAAKQKIKQPAKVSPITPYHAMDQASRDRVKAIFKEELNLQESLSIDTIESAIEKYNGGATVEVLFEHLGIKLQHNNPVVGTYNEELDKLLDEYILNHLLNAVKEYSIFSDRVRPSTGIDALAFLNACYDFLAKFDNNVDKRLVDILNKVELNTALEDLENNANNVTVSEAKDVTNLDNAFPVTRITPHIVTTVNNLISLCSSNEEFKTFEIKGFEDVSNDTIQEISTVYLAVVEKITHIVAATILLAQTVTRNITIYNEALLAYEKINTVVVTLFHKVYNTVSSYDSVETEETTGIEDIKVDFNKLEAQQADYDFLNGIKSKLENKQRVSFEEYLVLQRRFPETISKDNTGLESFHYTNNYRISLEAVGLLVGAIAAAAISAIILIINWFAKRKQRQSAEKTINEIKAANKALTDGSYLKLDGINPDGTVKVGGATLNPVNMTAETIKKDLEVAKKKHLEAIANIKEKQAKEDEEKRKEQEKLTSRLKELNDKIESLTTERKGYYDETKDTYTLKSSNGYLNAFLHGSSPKYQNPRVLFNEYSNVIGSLDALLEDLDEELDNSKVNVQELLKINEEARDENKRIIESENRTNYLKSVFHVADLKSASEKIRHEKDKVVTIEAKDLDKMETFATINEKNFDIIMKNTVERQLNNINKRSTGVSKKITTLTRNKAIDSDVSAKARATYTYIDSVLTTIRGDVMLIGALMSGIDNCLAELKKCSEQAHTLTKARIEQAEIIKKLEEFK